MRTAVVGIILLMVTGCVRTYTDTTPTHVSSETKVNYVVGSSTDTTLESKIKDPIFPARPKRLPPYYMYGYDVHGAAYPSQTSGYIMGP